MNDTLEAGETDTTGGPPVREASATRHPKVAYIMSRFPHLPETFILREMSLLEERGWPIALFPLINQKQDVVHEEAKHWLPRARKIGFLTLAGLWCNLRTAVRQPRTYAAIWLRIIRENITSRKFLTRSLALLPKSVQMAEIMKKEGVEHIHAHYATHPATAAWIINRLTGINYSITAHAHDIYVQQQMLTTKLGGATFIAAISDFNREFMARHAGDWVRDKTFIVHCGIVPENYPARQVAQSDSFQLLSIGSLQPYKGQKYLVDACALLKKRGIPVKCSIIGGGEEQPDLEARVRAAGLQDTVTLLGPQPQEEVARLLPLADCYVQPSVITPAGKMEGIPVSLMEALSCSLPVVASDISGISELVRPGDTGYLVPEKNPTALANTLEHVYQNPAEADRLAAAGRALVLQQFSLSHSVTLLEDLFTRSTRDEL